MIEKLENGLKMSFIMFWNLNGAFLRLKGTKFPSGLFGSLRFGFGFKFEGGLNSNLFFGSLKKGKDLDLTNPPRIFNI